MPSWSEWHTVDVCEVESGEVHFEYRVVTCTQSLLLIGLCGRKQISPLSPNDPTTAHDTGTGHIGLECRTGAQVGSPTPCMSRDAVADENKICLTRQVERRFLGVVCSLHDKPRPDAVQVRSRPAGPHAAATKAGAVDSCPLWRLGGFSVGDSGTRLVEFSRARNP